MKAEEWLIANECKHTDTLCSINGPAYLRSWSFLHLSAAVTDRENYFKTSRPLKRKTGASGAASEDPGGTEDDQN